MSMLLFDERYQVHHSSEHLALPPLQLDEPSHPLGINQGRFNIHDFDLTDLWIIHRDHQPEHAKHCARMRNTQIKPSNEISIKQQLVREFHKVLREEPDADSNTAGVDRRIRWTGNPGYTPVTTKSATGNSKNAAAVASTVTSRVSIVHTFFCYLFWR
jgi:hypothetical protein